MTKESAVPKITPEVTPKGVGGRIKLRRKTAQPKNTASLREALDDVGDLPRILDIPGVGPAALEIGQLIRRARAQAGLTQIDLAKAAGLTQGALSDIELGKGKEGPSYRILRDLWRALNRKSRVREMFGESLFFKPPLEIATPTERAKDVSAFSASAGGLIKMLLDEGEVSRIYSRILSTIGNDSARASKKYECMMWRVAPHAHTRIATRDLTIFLTVSGALRIKARGTVDSFDRVYIVLGNETVEVANPAAKPLSFISAPAAWFLSASE
jgi:transcriptional regulator with XRE-family HTH domain